MDESEEIVCDEFELFLSATVISCCCATAGEFELALSATDVFGCCVTEIPRCNFFPKKSISSLLEETFDFILHFREGEEEEEEGEEEEVEEEEEEEEEEQEEEEE